MKAASVSAVIVTYRSRLHIGRCVHSLIDEGILEIWVVDNASDDDTASYVSEHFPEAHLIQNSENIGFAAANNQALQRIATPFVLLINPDAWLEKGSLRHMLTEIEQHDDVAVVGPRMIRDEQIEPSLLYAPRIRDVWFFLLSGMRAFGSGGFSGRMADGYPWDAGGEGNHVRGSCMLVRMQAVREAGFLDESFFLYFEETEWCLRMHRHGWRIMLNAHAIAHHIGKASVRTHGTLPSLEYMRSAILFWHKVYPAPAAWLLRTTLLLMAVTKWLILGVLDRKDTDRRRWLGDVVRLSMDPYRLPIVYSHARRPRSWPRRRQDA
ncbi:MAG: glycosyltransferase family 2 protein [Mariprofundaceae bacterium]